jgi:hypothetical protein
MLGSLTGVTVSILYTLDREAYRASTLLSSNDPVGRPITPGLVPSSTTVTVASGAITVTGYVNGVYETAVIPSTSWQLMDGPSSNSGAGAVGNPLVPGTTQTFFTTQPVVAYRAVVTAVSSPSGSGSVVGFAMP